MWRYIGFLLLQGWIASCVIAAPVRASLTGPAMMDVTAVQIAPHRQAIVFASAPRLSLAASASAKSRLWIKLRGKKAHLLLPKFKESQFKPAWSRNGLWLSFLQKNKSGDRLWLVRSSGRDLHRLAIFPGQIVDYQWAPGSRVLAVRVAKTYGKKTISSSLQDKKNQRLWLVSINKRGMRGRLWPLTSSRYNVAGDHYAWSQAGKKIVFIKQATDSTDSYHRQLMAVFPRTATIKALKAKIAYINDPFFSHRSNMVAFISNQAVINQLGHLNSKAGLKAQQLAQVCWLTAAGNQTYCLKPWFNHGAHIVGWNADDDQVLLAVPDRLTTRLLALPIHGQSPFWISGQSQMITHPLLSYDGKTIGYSAQQSQRPVEAFVGAVGHFKPQKISSVNRRVKKPRTKTVAMAWMGAEHTMVEGLLTYPPGYRPGQRLPLIIVVTGGLGAHFSNNFTGALVQPGQPLSVASLARQGFVVLRPNLHGSVGYGNDFLLSTYKKVGLIQQEDLAHAIAQLQQKQIIDPARVGIWGWGYGGFLVLWLMEHDRLFKAGVDGAGISDWIAQAGVVNNYAEKYKIGTQYWQQPKPWWQLSPLFNANKLHGQLLMQTGSADRVVLPTQSERMDNLLLAFKKPVRWQVFQGEGHRFHNKKLLSKANAAMQLFFKQELAETKPASDKN